MSDLDGKQITREWFDEFLTDAFPGVLSKTAGVADFVKLVELQRRQYPTRPSVKEAKWLYHPEQDPDFMRP